MPHLSPRLLLLALVVVAFAVGCNSNGGGGDADGGGDGDVDGDTDTGTENEHVCPEYWEVADLVAALFACPTEVVEPCDLRLYRDYYLGNEALGFLAAAKEIGMAQVDLDQLVECELTGDEILCEEAIGETADGGSFEYRRTEVAFDDVWGDPVEEPIVHETLSVSLPDDVETYTSLEYAVTVTPSYQNGADKGRGSFHSVEGACSWDGVLDPSWPADDSVALEHYGYTDDIGGAETLSFMSNACELWSRLDEDWFEAPEVTHDVRVDMRRVKVQQWDWLGFVGGTCVGEVDPVTWEIVGGD